MARFIVTGSFQNQSGNRGTFRYEIDAADHGAAMDAARDRLQRDKRKRYMGKLDMSCAPAPASDEPRSYDNLIGKAARAAGWP